MDSLARLVGGRAALPIFNLSELRDLDRSQLGGLVPSAPEVSGVVERDGVFVVDLPDGQVETLFARGSLEEDVWSRMNGELDLRGIAGALASEWGITSESAFARTRELFLLLVELQLCLPCNSPV